MKQKHCKLCLKGSVDHDDHGKTGNTLYSQKVKNLICAGRCTSVTDSMWDVMRVIPCCAVTGQAAGTAAAMTDDFSTLDVAELQEILVRDGVVLHEA